MTVKETILCFIFAAFLLALPRLVYIIWMLVM